MASAVAQSLGMKSRFLVLAITCALAACGPSAQPSAEIDRDTALKASPQDLARRGFAAVSDRFVEIERPVSLAPPGSPQPLLGLRMATAAESAGYPGLCKAATTWISLSTTESDPLSTRTVYKVVGDLSPLPDMWNDAYGKDLERRCAKAGRVLQSTTVAYGETPFFKLDQGEDENVWYAVLALQRAVAAAKAGGPVTCHAEPRIDEAIRRDMAKDDPELIEDDENQAGCAQPGKTLAGLSLDRMLDLTVVPCPDRLGTYCVSASFLRYAYDNRQALWMANLRYRLAEKEQRALGEVTDIVLAPSFNVWG